MSSRAKKALVAVVIAALVIPMLSCIFSSPKFNDGVLALTTDPDKEDDKNGTTPPTPTPGEEDKMIPFQYVHFYTYDPKDAEYYFGPNARTEALAAVAAGTAKDELSYYVNFSDYKYDPNVDPATLDLGNLMFRAKYDDAFCASLAYDLDANGFSGDDPILSREVNLPAEEKVNHATMEFLKDSEYYRTVWCRILTIYTSVGSTWEIVSFENYTSTMYMRKDGLGIGIPSVVVWKKDVSSEDSWFLKFTAQTEKDGEFVSTYYRLNCGYQPIDPPGWEPPPDEPTPTPTSTPTPTPPDEPTPTPTSTPTPTPKPKDVADDPQNKADPTEPGADDFKSPDPSNQDPDKTVTEEPTSPASYATPTPPPPVTATPTPKPTSTPAPTAAPQTTTATPTPKPTTGNSSSSGYKPVEDVANNTPAKPVTDEPVSGDVPPPE